MPKRTEGKIYAIGEAAELLNRKPRTLREWEHSDVLPEHLTPPRDKHGRRVYSAELVEHIREWLIARGVRHGTNFIRRQAGA